MEDRLDVSIAYPNGVTDGAALVTPLGSGEYRLEQDPLSCLIADRPRDLKDLPNYGDVIAAEVIGPGALRFVKVVERAPLKRFQFLIPRDIAESRALEIVLSKVEAITGHWERVMGGVLIIYLPKDCNYDPSKEILRMGRDD